MLFITKFFDYDDLDEWESSQPFEQGMNRNWLTRRCIGYSNSWETQQFLALIDGIPSSAFKEDSNLQALTHAHARAHQALPQVLLAVCVLWPCETIIKPCTKDSDVFIQRKEFNWTRSNNHLDDAVCLVTFCKLTVGKYQKSNLLRLFTHGEWAQIAYRIILSVIYIHAVPPRIWCVFSLKCSRKAELVKW